MEYEFIDHELTLLDIMDSDSELQYITEERNLIPSMIEQICTELTEKKSDGAAHRSDVIVKKKSVDYYESLGYNLFRQFESDMNCVYFDRPVSNENMKSTVKFAISTSLDHALDIFAHGFPSIFTSLLYSSLHGERQSEDAFHPDIRNRIDHPTNFTRPRNLRNRSVLPVWGSFRRLPTSYPRQRLINSSLHEYPLQLEELNRVEYFYKVTTLRSSLKDKYSNMSDFEDSDLSESEDSNPGTPDTSSTQNDTNMDSCASSVTVKHVNENSVTEVENSSLEIARTQTNFNLSNLRVDDISSDENNVRHELPAVRGGHMKHGNSSTIRFSQKLSEDDSSSSDSLEGAFAVKKVFRNPENYFSQSTGTYFNASYLDSYVQRPTYQESQLPLTMNKNYSEASKADEFQEQNLYLSTDINDQETSFSPTPVSDDNSSSSVVLVANAVKTGYRNDENSRFQSALYNSLLSGFYDQRSDCRNHEESRISLNRSNNYSEADEVKENLYLPKKINDLENQINRNRENCARLTVSLDASLEDHGLSALEQDHGLLIRENPLFPKDLALKRSASSPAMSPRNSFRCLRNPKKYRLSQPDLTDSQINDISNFPSTSTTNKNNSFSNPDVFQTQETSREIFVNASHCETENAANNERNSSVIEVDSFNQQEETTRHSFHLEGEPENCQSEEGSKSEQRKNDDVGSLDCEQNQSSHPDLQENEQSAMPYLLQDSEGLIQPMKTTTDDQVKEEKELPSIDLPLVWNRKYFDSKHHIAFKFDHPFLYKQEYHRIRKTRVSVFNSLMSRQTNGPLSQRKVLEVVARPYYSIYPPTDVTEMMMWEQSRYSRQFINVKGYLMLSLESCRTFVSYPSKE